MRRFAWVFLSCGCTAAPPPVEIAVPLASPPPPASLDDEVPLPKAAVLARSAAEGSWVIASCPKAPGFHAVDLPRSSRVLLEWRVGASRKVKDLPPEEDYPANYVAPVELVLRSRTVQKTITFGELAGSPDPAHQSYCAHAGYTMPSSPELGRPQSRSAAAWFSVGVMQGDDEFMIVRDGDVLHVLHRETSDGKCDETQQGPLEVCEGFEWARVADVRGTRDAGLFETITDDGKDIDCGAERMGERLTRP